MNIGKDKAGHDALRLTARATSAVLGWGIAFAAPMSVYAQSLSPGQNLDDTLPASTLASPTDPTTTSTGGAQAVQPTNPASAGTSNSDAPPNMRLRLDGVDPITTGSTLDNDLRRVNLAEPTVDGLKARQYPDRADVQGIPLGTFTLRPSVNQSINVERDRTGSTENNRTFLQTDLRSTVTSDWDRHALTVTGEGVWQKNLSGTSEEKPTINLNADLRLDLPADTTAHITAGYQFYREDTSDPNAIAGASKQSAVNQFTTGLSLERDFGLLRGTTALALTRTVYSDAVLSDGTKVTLSDRDQTAGTWRGRIGYELSPAIIPFVEVDLGRAVYDQTRDSNGYARSNQSYGGKGGVEFDLGEKFKGELGFGYQHTQFDDSRLASVDSPTIDGNLAWSPQRGTDISIGLSTTVQPSTTAGLSGYTAYQLTSTVSRQLRDDLTAKVTSGTIWRNYPSNGNASDETEYGTAFGLTWGINRYLDLTSNIGYQLTTRDVGDSTHQLQAGVGLTVKR
ncbi:outer membrane beta-barrel protein [Rhizobium sp. P40RR-XXII]|uniref:outer membrane beta-barrel protein n=1 Tax=unclassified Rhizobium TaxID=2613769 RepID=UPI0014575139|nr:MULTISPECIES: outer membrane beta-barrel protein [unclassified Rhizobium]NLR84220.1 outer membrane beta-barrel protein [Rhizobium sp. P28RR-XV]NLS15134.1 outer membrane beta-barrel protein [Rhizobium sp. P40RR-XXII]